MRTTVTLIRTPKNRMLNTILSLLACLTITLSAAEVRVLEPASPLTKSLLSAVRPAVQAEIERLSKTVPELKGAKAKLTAGTTRASDSWALVIASFEPGFAEGVVHGVLKKEKGKWKLVWSSFLEEPPTHESLKTKIPGVPAGIFLPKE
jgi:hypothetical protein